MDRSRRRLESMLPVNQVRTRAVHLPPSAIFASGGGVSGSQLPAAVKVCL
jgi:hypothetical protein